MNHLDPAESRLRRVHLTLTAGLVGATIVTYVSALLLTWPELPATMATHFGINGVADELMPTPQAVAVQGLVVIGVPLTMMIVFGATRWWQSEYARSFSALLGGLSAGLGTLFVALLVAHEGIADPTLVTLSARTGLLAIGIGVLVALVARLVLPKPLPRGAPVRVEPLALAPTARASWFGRATVGKFALAALAGGLALMVLAAIVSNIWWLWLFVLLLVVLAFGMASFEVTIDGSGLSWRAALGVPRGHIDLAAIDGAAVIDVSPGDYGGIGLRLLAGRLGIITRAGPALLVSHAGRKFVGPVDDPAGAAALIEGLRAGRASRRPAGSARR